MGNDIVSDIVDNLFHVLPLIHRKLLKIDLEAVSKDIARPHFAIMWMLDEIGTAPVSEIGKRLIILKPQMTHLVDKLIGLGMVERLPDAKDRRIINIRLTQKGKRALGEGQRLVRENIGEKLASLKDDELQELSVSLKKLREIGSKIE